MHGSTLGVDGVLMVLHTSSTDGYDNGGRTAVRVDSEQQRYENRFPRDTDPVNYTDVNPFSN